MHHLFFGLTANLVEIYTDLVAGISANYFELLLKLVKAHGETIT